MDETRVDRLARVYTRFSTEDAAGRSPLYAELTRAVSEDRELLGILCELPPAKRQPNLLLAAVRHLYGDYARDWPEFRGRFFDRQPEVLEIIRTHRTQTNEPARCATLLPVLASLPQPLALLEIGTSAGLCLLPDRYGYEYLGVRPLPATAPKPAGRGSPPLRLVTPALEHDGPVFRCDVNEATPLPRSLPSIAWRAGLDLSPIDVMDDESVSWLESLVWPGEGDRLALLRAAVRVARPHPPRIVRGDLRRDLPALAAQTPADATLVIFHTAVLSYLPDQAERQEVAGIIRTLGARWIANEAVGLIDLHGGTPPEPPTGGAFLISLDSQPLAWADSHGAWLRWLE